VTAGRVSSAGGSFGTAYDADNSYATGTVTTDDSSYAAGFVGQGFGGGDQQFLGCYSLGQASAGVNSYIGGFVGISYGNNNFAADYWDVDTSQSSNGCGEGDCTNVTGLTDVQLKSELPAGFDPNVWGQKKSINNGYPYLLANPPPQ
jgi:hypothetical protein